MSYINIDIDLDEVYSNLDRWDKAKLAEWLEEDGFYIESTPPENKNPIDLEWDEIIAKIANRTSLTAEQEEAIKNIANGKI